MKTKKKHTPEGKIQSRIMLAVGSLPGVVVQRNTVGSYRERNGWITYGLGTGSPDIVGWIMLKNEGVTVPVTIGIEVKTPRGKVSKDQAQWHRAAERNGVAVGVCRNSLDALTYVQGQIARFGTAGLAADETLRTRLAQAIADHTKKEPKR